MVNPFQNEGMKKFLATYGVDLGDDLVIESNPIGQLFGIGPEVPLVQQYEPHPITRDMSGITTLFPLTRSVGATKGQTPPGVDAPTLIRTSPQSWAETDRAALDRGEARAG